MNTMNPEVLNPQRRSNADNLAAIKGSIGDIKDSVGEVVLNERDLLQEKLEQGKVRVRAAQSGLENFVRERPVTSLMIAAGAGALLGYVLSRRR